MTKAPHSPTLSPLQIRVQLGGNVRFGPGKAQLLEAIRHTGSIARAGQSMAMSYKRAWSLVEEMNRLFAQPLVISTRGGTHGGGAALTETGALILQHYRAVEAASLQGAAPHLAAITAALAGPDRQ
jgi:molybdate transport system regulatory protein